MSDWVNVGSLWELAPGEHRVVDVDGTEVAVFNIDGEFFAIEDTCTHDGSEIASGSLHGHEIVCPRHGARFCLKTGKVLSPPAYQDLVCFPIRVENGIVQVRDPRQE